MILRCLQWIVEAERWSRFGLEADQTPFGTKALRASATRGSAVSRCSRPRPRGRVGRGEAGGENPNGSRHDAEPHGRGRPWLHRRKDTSPLKTAKSPEYPPKSRAQRALQARPLRGGAALLKTAPKRKDARPRRSQGLAG